MISVALSPRRTPESFRKFGRSLVALAVATALCVSAGAQAPREKIANGKYSGGACRLRLQAISLEPSQLARKSYVANLEFVLEFPQGTTTNFSGQLPPNFFLNNDRSPLVGARIGASKTNLAASPHNGTAEGSVPVVAISGLEVGPTRERLTDVEIEVVLVKITEWDRLKFDKIWMESGDFFQCGAFEYRVAGEPGQVHISAFAYPQFKADHDAYRKRMPLRFLTQGYAIQELKLVDSAGRSPTGQSVSGGGGASIATYSTWRPPADAPAAAAGSSDEIAYPITLSVSLPKRFETERVRFHFDEIALPAP